MLGRGESLSPSKKIVSKCPHVPAVLDHLFRLQHLSRGLVVPAFPKSGSFCFNPCDIFRLFPCSAKPVRDWQILMQMRQKVNVSGQDTSAILNAQFLSQSLLKILEQLNHLFVSFSPFYAELSST